MRGGLNFSSGQDAEFDDLGSRWGVKGSNEVSEGLSAVYQYEVDIDQPEQGGNRLAYAGLSGGFGRVLLGKFTSATNAHNGFARDPSIWLGASGTDNKLTNGISYGASTGPASFQVDAYLNPDADTGGGIDQAMFGASFDMGFGKIGVGYNDVKDSYKDHDIALRESNVADEIYGSSGAVWRTTSGHAYKGKVKDVKLSTVDANDSTKVKPVSVVNVLSAGETIANDNVITLHTDGNYYDFESNGCASTTLTGCSKTVENVHVEQTTNPVTSDEEDDGTDVTFSYKAVTPANVKATATGTETKRTYGHSKMHASAKFDVAGVGLGLGYSQTESNDPMKEDTEEKTAYLALNGSAGDTGIAWALWARDVTDNAHVEDDDRSPWGLSVSRALGGGATAFVEHSNDDKPEGEDSTSVVGLIVNF